MLTADAVVEALVADLKERGRLGKDRAAKDIPICELAPVLVDEYVMPTNPTAEEVATLW